MEVGINSKVYRIQSRSGRWFAADTLEELGELEAWLSSKERASPQGVATPLESLSSDPVRNQSSKSETTEAEQWNEFERNLDDNARRLLRWTKKQGTFRSGEAAETLNVDGPTIGGIISGLRRQAKTAFDDPDAVLIRSARGGWYSPGPWLRTNAVSKTVYDHINEDEFDLESEEADVT